MQTAAESAHSRWITFTGLSLIVILGAYLRLSSLDEKSVTHVEMYVPGIRMPIGISVPGERLTLTKVLTGTFSSDTHPPAYYMLMWVWTKAFGTGVRALRVPSALLGIGSIPLIFWLGTLTRQRTAGWIASVLLAVNPHHIFWSQVARMFTLACFLGLLATILLLLISRSGQASRSLGVLYVLVILLGVSSHIFFWALFVTHMLWTFFTAWSQRQPIPGIGTLQIFALIFCSPLLAFAAYQGGNELASLSGNALIYAREFLQFCFLFPLTGFSSGVYPLGSDAPLVDDPHLSISRCVFFLLSAILFFAGVASIRKSDKTLLSDPSGISPKTWWLGGGFGTLAILFFIFMAKRFLKVAPNATLRTTELMVVLPLVLAGLATALRKAWPRVANSSQAIITSRFVNGEQALVLDLVAVPFAVLAFVSRFKVIFNARGMLLLGPYLLLVLAWGIARVGRRRAVAVALAIGLSIANYAGLKAYSHMSAGRADYKAFASVLDSHVNKADLLFVQPSWYSTPIYYYLNAGWDRFVGKDYQAACRQNPRARVWVLLFYDENVPKGIEQALASYQAVETIEIPRARAVLYSPRDAQTAKASCLLLRDALVKGTEVSFPNSAQDARAASPAADISPLYLRGYTS